MTILYLAWQEPKERHWFPVGRLSFDGVMYRFVYTKGATRSPDFMPFAQMPDLHTCYASAELFPLFKNRILSKSRPEYPSFLNWLDVSTDADDPLTLLARSGGERATDSLRIIPYPVRSPEGLYRLSFFSHGIRYLPDSVKAFMGDLTPGDAVLLMPDPQNPFDADALALRTASPAVMVGYCPRYLNRDFRVLLQADAHATCVHVERINCDAPLQLRLMCKIQAPWPEHFQPCSGEDYEVLAEETRGDGLG
jgi:HIRAN domain